MKPTISILLPVHNAQLYLQQALLSLSNQTYTDFEIIAIDDGSTDGSAKILSEAQKNEPRLKIFSGPHMGLVHALNLGLQQAQGMYIARMDADDISYPKRLKHQLFVLNMHPEAVAVGSWVRFIDAQGSPIYTYRMPDQPEKIEKLLWEGNGGAIVHPTGFFRAQAIRDVGGYRSTYQSLEDLDLYLRLLDIGCILNVPEVLLDYRQHLSSVNFTSDAAERKLLQKKLMEEHTQRKGKPMPILKGSLHDKSTLEIYHQWAYWALEEDFKRTAIRYTIKGILQYPLNRSSWSFLKYILLRLARG